MIYLLDLGINNIGSMMNSFGDLVATELQVTSEPVTTGPKDLIVLPGTGSFAVGMARLRSRGLQSFVSHEASVGRKILGICLGMQLLGEASEESPGIAGLSLISSASFRLNPGTANQMSVPHVGWSSISRAEDSQFGDFDFENGRDVFFSHSYAMSLSPNQNYEQLLTPWGDGTFTSGFRIANIMGLQFHPEKSSGLGRSMLSNIVEWSRAEV